MKRTPIRPVSKNRQRVNKLRAEMMEEHFGPKEGWVCWFMQHSLPIAGGCYGSLAGHEILKRSRAGSTDKNLLDMENIVILCLRHNGWVECEPDLAHSLGLAKHAWEVE